VNKLFILIFGVAAAAALENITVNVNAKTTANNSVSGYIIPQLNLNVERNFKILWDLVYAHKKWVSIHEFL
jgi:hypothetical protein